MVILTIWHELKLWSPPDSIDGLIEKDTIKPSADTFLNYSKRYIAPLQISPVRFFARKAEWSARRNFTSMLFPWSHQVAGPIRLAASAYLRFGWIIRRTPRVPRAMPVWAPFGPRTGVFNVFHILRDPYGARAWPARVPNGALTDM